MSLDAAFEETLRRIIREELKSLPLGDRLLTAEQVAEMLGYEDTHSVYRLKREGKLEAVYIGEKSPRYRNSDVQRIIKGLAA